MTPFDPILFPRSGKTAPNRIALAPMTNQQSNADGTLGEDEYQWLIRRAEGGFGIIITGAVHVSQDGQGWDGELGVYSDHQIPGLTRLAKGIKEKGSLAIVQIFHGGARAPQSVTGIQPWSATAQVVPAKSGDLHIREGTIDDIQRVIQDFGTAARRCADAGFDGVEIHGAHGYLLSQFLSSTMNRRQDEWGGSFENRCRLLLEVIREIKKNVPGDFIIGIRISPENYGQAQGIDFDETLKLGKELVKEGIDFLHVSIWDAMKKPDHYPKGKTIIEYYRELLPGNIPLLVAGGISLPSQLAQVLKLGADGVAVGKIAIGNPDWAKEVRNSSYLPAQPPYTPTLLRQRKIGKAFINYLRKWKNFVTD